MKIFCSCLGRFNLSYRSSPAHAFAVSIVGVGTESVTVCHSSMEQKTQPHLQLSEATREQIAGGLLGIEFQILLNHFEHQLLPAFLFHK